MENYNYTFGAVLRTLRLEDGQTQAALALNSGLDRTYISLLELGHRSPSLDTMVALCRGLNISFILLAQRFEEGMMPNIHTDI